MKVKRIKQEYYLGELVRDVCPSLYGKPIYNEQGQFISYTIVIPDFLLNNSKKEGKKEIDGKRV